jgi:hypothetical protein
METTRERETMSEDRVEEMEKKREGQRNGTRQRVTQNPTATETNGRWNYVVWFALRVSLIFN